MSKEKILREFMDKIWNGKRKDLIGKYVADEYKIHLDSGDHWEGEVLSHDEFEKRLDFSFNSFPDIHFEIKSAIEEENHVAITWIMTGTNLGKIENLEATNRKIETAGITIYYFDGLLISGHAQVFDRQCVMKQLGFI